MECSKTTYKFARFWSYFRTHIRNFSTLAGPLNFLSRKIAGRRGGYSLDLFKKIFLFIRNLLKNCKTQQLMKIDMI
jgi:hypothetical protein